MLFKFYKKINHKKFKIIQKKFLLFWTESSLVDYIILLFFEKFYLMFFIKSTVVYFIFSISDNLSFFINNCFFINFSLLSLFNVNRNFLLYSLLYVYLLFIFFCIILVLFFI